MKGLGTRLVLVLLVAAAFALVSSSWSAADQRSDMADAMLQLKPDNDVGATHARMMTSHHVRTARQAIGWWIVALASVAFIGEGVISHLHRYRKFGCMCLLVAMFSGCYRPFEPVKLEVIQPNEEAFLLPFTEDIELQTSTHTEDYLRRSLVHTQQVKIPQQWVPRGYETIFPNGEWRDAAILVRVDKSPVTREWTADPNSGTSAKNEAIWVMTSDQVEFSTGWTCTARVSSRDDAVKFLHNYPNGSLTKVMDQEVRAKLQSAFGLEVTDLPMEELRLKATPHIKSVVDQVIEFFLERGITITNLGISGGFVYKDPSIGKTMVEVFNAEQAKSIAIAETATQTEKNKTRQLEADARAKAILTEREAEAEGIKLVADAKSYEMSKAVEDPEAYMLLKRLEIEQARVEKWDGRFPVTMFGAGTENMGMLLSIGESTLTRAPQKPLSGPTVMQTDSKKREHAE